MSDVPEIPSTNGATPKLSTGEVAALQVAAKKEDAKRAPASHWDLVKSTVAILGTLAGIVLGFVTFGDRVVARAEGKTANGVKATNEVLTQHIEDSREVHAEIKDALKGLGAEQREFRADVKALYRAMPSKRPQSRLELDVREPPQEDLDAIGLRNPLPMVTPMPAPPRLPSDGGR